MSTRKVFVTGASGFIGRHFVKRLVTLGENVTCLARVTSDVSALEKLNCSIVYGDIVKNPDDLSSQITGCDLVFHLADLTHAIDSRDLVECNTRGFKNVLEACAACPSPPTLVFVSSLAAVGPNPDSRPLRECDPRKPVSNYGRGKAKSELLALKHAANMPISIVRPPIVLGAGDRHGLEMFRLIDKWGFHVVPGFRDRYFSIIHVDDLVTSLILVADRGKRLSQDSESEGIYFASADEIFTYAELGKMIGEAVGRRRTRILRVGKRLLWTVAAINEIKARLTSKPEFLNLDKIREATAGSWSCSNAKIKNEVGFDPALTMLERLRQTADGYRQYGWLDKKVIESSTETTRPLSGA